jgi:uncharacterized protein YecE (DUF72 family)
VRNAPAVLFSEPAPGVVVGGCRVLAGSSSWADRSLVRDGSFYPSRSLTASQRLLHYASRLPLTEVATTYRFPPTPDVAKRWVASTPPGFTFDVRAWSLLSGSPTWPESLWADLQGQVRPSRREGVKLYRHHLPSAVLDECWERFNHAVRPLAEAGRLGAIIMRYPTWFRPRLEAWEELAYLPSRLPGLRVAVELTSERWFEGGACEQTLGLLEELGLGFVCKDGPGPSTPVVAATSEVGFVRFTGSPSLRRDPASHEDVPFPSSSSIVDIGPEPQADERTWWYRYSEAELAGWAPAIRDLASCTSEVHVVMDNCWRANAVDNATSLLELLARS